MKGKIAKFIATFCVVALIPTTAFGYTEQDNIKDNDIVQIEKINDSGMSDEELTEIETEIDAYIEKTKREKEMGYTKPKMSVPKQILLDEERERKVDTYASDYEEYEPNDTMKNADKLHLDEYTDGTIENEDDVDYYKIKFSRQGQGYFRLVVPDDVDYDFYLIASNGTEIKEGAEGSDGETERIYAFVTPDIYYYIRVEGFGSSDYDDTEQYRIRAKFYDDIEETAFCVGADFTSYDPPSKYDPEDIYPDKDDIDTTDAAKNVKTILKDTDYYNTEIILEPTYRELDDVNNDEDETDRLGSSIVFLDGHGAPDHIKFYFNDEEDEYYVSGISATKKEDVHHDYDFDYVRLQNKEINSRLMVFAACQTAGEPEKGRNLPDYATRNGAECAIGWKENVKEIAFEGWSKIFFDELADGHTVFEAALSADEPYPSSDSINSWEIYGNEDCIIYPGSGTPISRSANMDININNQNTSLYGFDEINVLKDDLTDLNRFISENYADIDDYKITVNERDSKTLQIYYEKLINGFNTNSGLYVVARNGKVIYISEKEFEPGNEEELLKQNVYVDSKIENEVKEKALEEIPSSYCVTEQELSREIINGKYSLVVVTSYLTSNNEADAEYGCKEFIYEL